MMQAKAEREAAEEYQKPLTEQNRSKFDMPEFTTSEEDEAPLFNWDDTKIKKKKKRQRIDIEAEIAGTMALKQNKISQSEDTDALLNELQGLVTKKKGGDDLDFVMDSEGNFVIDHYEWVPEVPTTPEPEVEADPTMLRLFPGIGLVKCKESQLKPADAPPKKKAYNFHLKKLGTTTDTSCTEDDDILGLKGKKLQRVWVDEQGQKVNFVLLKTRNFVIFLK